MAKTLGDVNEFSLKTNSSDVNGRWHVENTWATFIYLLIRFLQNDNRSTRWKSFYWFGFCFSGTVAQVIFPLNHLLVLLQVSSCRAKRGTVVIWPVFPVPTWTRLFPLGRSPAARTDYIAILADPYMYIFFGCLPGPVATNTAGKYNIPDNQFVFFCLIFHVPSKIFLQKLTSTSRWENFTMRGVIPSARCGTAGVRTNANQFIVFGGAWFSCNCLLNCIVRKRRHCFRRHFEVRRCYRHLVERHY